MSISEDVEWLNEQHPGRVWDVRNLPLGMGKFAPCISFQSLTATPQKVSLQVFNPWSYFLCRNNFLDFTCCLGTNSIQQAASPGPSSCASSRLLTSGRFFWCRTEVLLALESHTREKTWLLSCLDKINFLPFCSTQLPLYSEIIEERIFIQVTPFWFVLSKEGISKSIQKKVTTDLMIARESPGTFSPRPRDANLGTCSCSKPYFL